MNKRILEPYLYTMKNIFFSFLFITAFGQAQEVAAEHLHFADQVEALQKQYDTLWDASKETIVFTGSSSIRIWKDLGSRFPDHQIVNSGFGGSQTSDLLAYTNELILRYSPKKVFIYEGDNDIAAEKKSKNIIIDMLAIIAKIKEQSPTTQIILIATKPSIRRWELKKEYKRLNRKFKKLCKKDAQLHYADVWKPMLNKKNVKKDLFTKDGLHMNTKGYDIWYDVLKQYVEAP